MHVHVRTTPGQIKDVNLTELENSLNRLMQDWSDEFEASLVAQVGEASANRLIKRYADFIPASYREAFDPRTAVLDIERLSGLSDTPNDLHWHLYHATGEQANQLNLKVYGRVTCDFVDCVANFRKIWRGGHSAKPMSLLS